mmetsp:Transcript_13670/g.40103  ORF Transcript_13670/g.40103 Transcript_13670/m.40103 type:complete len:466 (-) Transcript_13670:799-2196(-)
MAALGTPAVAAASAPALAPGTSISSGGRDVASSSRLAAASRASCAATAASIFPFASFSAPSPTPASLAASRALRAAAVSISSGAAATVSASWRCDSFRVDWLSRAFRMSCSADDTRSASTSAALDAATIPAASFTLTSRGGIASNRSRATAAARRACCFFAAASISRICSSHCAPLAMAASEAFLAASTSISSGAADAKRLTSSSVAACSLCASPALSMSAIAISTSFSPTPADRAASMVARAASTRRASGDTSSIRRSFCSSADRRSCASLALAIRSAPRLSNSPVTPHARALSSSLVPRPTSSSSGPALSTLSRLEIETSRAFCFFSASACLDSAGATHSRSTPAARALSIAEVSSPRLTLSAGSAPSRASSFSAESRCCCAVLAAAARSLALSMSVESTPALTARSIEACASFVGSARSGAFAIDDMAAAAELRSLCAFSAPSMAACAFLRAASSTPLAVAR